MAASPKTENLSALLAERAKREEERARETQGLYLERLRRKAHSSFLAFARYCTKDRFKTPRHIRLLAEKLEAVERGEIKRLIVSMPPRHGKSWSCSRFFPAWFLGRNPDKCVMLASYAAGFSKKWGGRARELIEEHGRAVFRHADGRIIEVKGDTSAKDEWEIARSEGGMKTDGVGGSLTGRGADLLIIDDPVKNDEEADSEVYRDKVWDWYDTTAHSRLEPGGAVVVIMTRWHEDDLVGRLLAEEQEAIEEGEPGEGWVKVVMPALCEDPETDPLGRAKGAALWPERFPADSPKFLRAKRRARAWAALYQQRPRLPDGNLFKSDRFRFYTTALERDGDTERRFYRFGGAAAWGGSFHLYTTADYAFSKEESADNSSIGVWGFYADFLWLLEVHCGRYNKMEILRIYEGISERWGSMRHWGEMGAFKKAKGTMDWLRHNGVIISQLGSEHGTKKDKYARADSAQPWFEEGRVLFCETASWYYRLVEELLAFPRGKDDQVDMISYGVLAAPWNVGHAHFKKNKSLEPSMGFARPPGW